MMDATAMTDVTPMTMPSTVSPDRTLCDRSVSVATIMFSNSSWRVIASLRPERHHRVQARGPDRRVDTEEKPDHRTQDQSHDRHPGLDGSRKRGEVPQQQCDAEAGENPDEAASDALGHTLSQELPPDIGRAR